MDLAARWPLPGADALRDRLVKAYADPARGYHDLTHLAEVLGHLDEVGLREMPASDRDAVVLAAWFHDAVYDVAGELEERSARLAEQELAELGADPWLTAEVARLVRLTATHRPADDDLAGQVLCDADLAILAADEERYAGYVAGVRREYAHVTEDDFRRGRAAVLEDLAAESTLFHTVRGRELWESRARTNLARELAELTRGPATGG